MESIADGARSWIFVRNRTTKKNDIESKLISFEDRCFTSAAFDCSNFEFKPNGNYSINFYINNSYFLY